MSNFLLAVSLTFAGSVHCLGMCGGFVALIGAAPGSARVRLFLNHMLMQFGKMASYLFLGSLAGSLGAALIRHPAFRWGERGLAIISGIALIIAGLALLGFRRTSSGSFTNLAGAVLNRVLGPLVKNRPAGFPLVVGMIMGFLPCPLVYAGLAAAAASGNALSGAIILAGVAAGTVPALAGLAFFGSVVPQSQRMMLARAAGVILLAAAAITLARGFGFHAPSPEGGCCH